MQFYEYVFKSRVSVRNNAYYKFVPMLLNCYIIVTNFYTFITICKEIAAPQFY